MPVHLHSLLRGETCRNVKFNRITIGHEIYFTTVFPPFKGGHVVYRT